MRLALSNAARRRRKVAAHFDALGLTGIDLRDEVRDIELAVKQKIEIARALYREPKILLLDEPTSSLSGRDVDWLGDIIARERAKGVTIVFISHRLHEVRAFCDRMTVLRNGRHIATAKCLRSSRRRSHPHDRRSIDRPGLSAEAHRTSARAARWSLAPETCRPDAPGM